MKIISYPIADICREENEEKQILKENMLPYW